MSSGREIGRLLAGLLIALGCVMLSVTYWVVTGQDTVLLREDNPRSVEFTNSILRGAIFDRDDTLLAQTVPLENRLVQRDYFNEAFFGTLGYYSFRYGTGGVEASYDALLSGANLPNDLSQWFSEDILHQARVGTDIRLTLDSGLQTTVYEAMKGQIGAVIVLDVPSGDIVSLVSLPTFNPNTLDADWETLTQVEGKPFFNRVLQGSYQAGGLLQTALMATAFLTNYDLNLPIVGASAPLELANITLNCALQPPDMDLSLLDAYAYGCPNAFANFIDQSNPSTIENLLATFALNQPPIIADFSATRQPLEQATPEVTPETTAQPETTFLEDMLGQGQVTVNPLAVAQLVSAIINNGEAPVTHLLTATRAPLSDVWQVIERTNTAQPLMTDTTSRQLRDWMLRNSQVTGLVNPTMGSHVAIAYSGNTAQAWFIGFTQDEDGGGRVVVVVLENSTDLVQAAKIGEVAIDLMR